jgi:hypothetical protein
VADVGPVKTARLPEVLLAHARHRTSRANPPTKLRRLLDATSGPFHLDECRLNELDASTANN